MQMTSRERVLRAVNFQPTDRVPIDLGSMKASGIAVKAYNRVKTKLGIETRTRNWDPVFMLAFVEEIVLRRFHADVMPLDISTAIQDMQPDAERVLKTLYEGAEGLLPPGTAVGTDTEGRWALIGSGGAPTSFRMPRDGYYFDDISFDRPGSQIDPKAFKPITGFSDEQLRALQTRGKFLYENADYALLGWGVGVCFLGLSLITERSSNVAGAPPPSGWSC